MKPFFILLICLYSISVFSQTKNQISDSVEISDQGWNKVLMTRNGNTLLFHLELREPILIKVFDNTGKEVASQSYKPIKLKVDNLDHAIIKAVYDINGEAVI